MQTILMLMGFLILGLMALIFLYVFVKMIGLLNDSYGSEDDSDDPNSPVDMNSFRQGFNQGIFFAQMGLYKIWIEGEESMIIGTFDNLRGEIDQNLSQFFQDSTKMKEWNDKYLKYVIAKQNPPTPESEKP